MPRPTTPLVAGTHYHIFNRGNNRQAIFFERRENYLFFLDRMREYLLEIIPSPQGSEAGQIAATTIVSYCLMPKSLSFAGLPERRRPVQPHATAFNFVHQRRSTNAIGASVLCSKGRFGNSGPNGGVFAAPVALSAPDPVFAGLVQRAEDWEFSSYRDYSGITTGELGAAGSRIVAVFIAARLSGVCRGVPASGWEKDCAPAA